MTPNETILKAQRAEVAFLMREIDKARIEKKRLPWLIRKLEGKK